MEFKAPKRNILRPTLSFDMVQHILRWEKQKRCSCRKRHGPWQRNVVVINFKWIFLGEEKMKTREDKKMVKPEFYFSFKTTLFGHTVY